MPLSERSDDLVLVNCLTLWISNLVLRNEAHDADTIAVTETKRLLDLFDRQAAWWVLIRNEVGMGGVQPTPLGSRFRDLLGRVSQIIAERADKAYLMVAGLAVDLKASGAKPFG